MDRVHTPAPANPAIFGPGRSQRALEVKKYLITGRLIDMSYTKICASAAQSLDI